MEKYQKLPYNFFRYRHCYFLANSLRFLRFFTSVPWGFLPSTNLVDCADNCYTSLIFSFFPFFYFSSPYFPLKPPALTTCSAPQATWSVRFSLAWLDCSRLPVWWNPRLLFLSRCCLQNFQDNPEYNSVLPFRIILKIFAVNMLNNVVFLHDQRVKTKI